MSRVFRPSIARAIGPGEGTGGNAGDRPRFAPGQRVRIAERFPIGHYRTPLYVRGRTGEIERVLQPFLNPEEEAFGRNEGGRQRLYRVRLKQSELWPGYAGAPSDELQIEIYEHWLEQA